MNEIRNTAETSTKSQTITDFQISCQKYFICYSFAIIGLGDYAKKLVFHAPNLDGRLIVGSGHPNTGVWHAATRLGEIVDSSQPNGVFADKIAKSFITAIYSEWDEVYRHQLASEAKVESKTIRSNLMSDVRLIRHCIVHNKSIIKDEPAKIRELKWQLSPGALLITREMFSTLIDQINNILVWADPK